MFGANANIVIAFGRAGGFCPGRKFSLIVGQVGHAYGRAGQHPRRGRIHARLRRRAADRLPHGHGHRHADRRPGLLGAPRFSSSSARRRLTCCWASASAYTARDVMRGGGGIYTKAGRRRRRPGGQGRRGARRGRPAQRGRHRRPVVGDNVGDCAGMAADIFESYEVTIVSTLILGIALMALTGNVYFIVFPLLVRAIGVISSIIGTFSVPVWNAPWPRGMPGTAWRSRMRSPRSSPSASRSCWPSCTFAFTT